MKKPFVKGGKALTLAAALLCGCLLYTSRIRKLENRYHAQVLFSHDIDQYETYRKAPLEWYE